MKYYYSFILLFFLFNLSFSDGYNHYFKDFYLGESIEIVKNKLIKYQSLFKEEDRKPFRMNVPLFLYLNSLSSQHIDVDIQNGRIYIDDYHFFDFKDVVINESEYDFYYDRDYYYFVFNQIYSYPVSYPSRINPHLKELKFKFFKGVLYSIEYRASLKTYQIHRLKKIYYENYGININKKENIFQTEQGQFIVKIITKKNEVKVIIMSRQIYSKIEKYIHSTIMDMLAKIIKKIDIRLKITEGVKKLLLQQRKKILKNTIKRIYQSIDEL